MAPRLRGLRRRRTRRGRVVSWKRRLRGALDGAARVTGVLAAFERRHGARPLVLMHHRVLPRAQCAHYPFPSLALELELFEAEVAWLAANFEVLTLAAAFRASRESPRRCCVLTFDDGYADNFELAAPILERHGVRGVFFVATDFVGQRERLWYDRAALALGALAARLREQELARLALDAGASVGAAVQALKGLAPAERSASIARWESQAGPVDSASFAPMSPAQVRELAARGHEIGAHSVSHAMLPQCDDAQLERELVESRARLSEWTSAQVTSLCYPDGAHDARVVAAARRVGYTLACTTQPPQAEAALEPMALARIDITRERICDLHGAFDPLALRAELAGFHEALR